MQIDFIKRIFAKPAPAPPAAPARDMQGEIGWSGDSLLYSAKDFRKWNQDDLLRLKGRSIYRKMMRDDQVKAVVRFKQSAVVSRKWDFKIGVDDEGEDREDHAEMAEFFRFVLGNMRGNLTSHLVGILSSIQEGFSITEMVFAPVQWRGKTMWGLETLKLRPAHTFQQGIEIDKHGNITRLVQNEGAEAIPIPYDKVIHMVHQPDFDPHYGESDLRACYREWWSKDVVIKFQNIHLERHASGFVWAQVKGEVGATERNNLKNLIDNMSARTGAIVPEAVALNMMQPVNTKAYEDAIAQYDKGIAKALLVPNLLGITEQGTTGSYAQSQTQISAFFWVLDSLANQIEEALNEQLFLLLARWNFGTEDFPPFVFEPISEDVKRQIAQTWGTLVSQGAVQRTDSDEAHIRRMVGFPEKAEVEQPPDAAEGTEADEELPVGGLPDNEEWIDKQDEQAKEAVLREFSERPWLKRVDFAALEKRMNDSEQAFADDLAAAFAEMRIDLERQISDLGGERSWGNVDPKAIATVKPNKDIVSRVRKVINGHLRSGLNDGYAGARAELPRKFDVGRIAPGMDKTQAWKYLSSKAMKIAGVTEADVLAAVQLILENALKYDKSLRDIIREIEENTDLLALLPKVDAAGRAINVPARLENIVRTNFADAINQGRQALFGDPSLRGFVLAYEYSAVMDGRTTEICEALHGNVRKDWGSMTPPNHYQCRSILVPVTVVDDWDGKEDKLPAGVQPMKGFA